MKKILFLLLFLIPAVSHADRLGGLNSSADVLLTTQAVSGGSGGYNVEPATITFKLNQGFSATTGTFTSLSPGIMHIVANSSATTTGLVLSTEIAATAVTPGSYTNTNLTVDQQGRITSASNGTSGGGGASTLAVGTGTPTSYLSNTSSPTAVFSLDSTQFRVLSVNSTAYVVIDTITANGIMVISSMTNYMTQSSATANYFKLSTANGFSTYGVLYGGNPMSATSGGSANQVLIGNNAAPPSFTGTPTVTSLTTIGALSAGTNITATGNVTARDATITSTMSVASTLTLSNLSPGVLHTVANSSATTTALVSFSTEATGTLQAAQTPAFIGGVTSSAGSLTLTVVTVPQGAIQSGSTNYIQSRTTLQTNATFYVSSGTATQLWTSSITAQPAANGVAMTILNATSSPSGYWDTTPAGLGSLFDVQDSTGRSVFQINGAGHVVSIGTTPALSACGTSPTLATNSTDFSGVITVGATATGCTLTFANAYTNRPSCNIENETLSITSAITYTVSTTQIVVSQSVGLGGDLLDYICLGK